MTDVVVVVTSGNEKVLEIIRQGPQGPPGPSDSLKADTDLGNVLDSVLLDRFRDVGMVLVNWLDEAYSSVTTYYAGDALAHNGSSYLNLVDGSLNAEPGVSPNWLLIAQGGNITNATGNGSPLTVNSLDSTAIKILLKANGVLQGSIGTSAFGFVLRDGAGAVLGFFVTVAGAVNYPVFQPSPTGLAVVLRPEGTDANINARLEQKGTGYVALTTTEVVRVYLDRMQVSVPTRLGNYTVAVPPSAAILAGTVAQISDAGGGPTLVISNGTINRRIDQPGILRNLTDANFTLQHLVDSPVVRHGGTLTADRTITLSPTGAVDGASFHITRQGGGAFNLSVGGLKNLVQNTWCIVKYDAVPSAWYLAAYGAL